MAKVNWGEDDGGYSGNQLSEPGTYFVEVVSCEEKESAGGDAYFNLRLKAPDFDDAFVGFDIVMLEGKGAGIGIQKMKGLGFTDKDGEDIQPEQFVGKKAWAVLDTDLYQGKVRLKVNIYADGAKGGYFLHADGEPEEVAKPVATDEAVSDDEPAPF